MQAGGRLAEYVGGLYGAPAVVVAAARARRTGVGEHIDLSLAEAMAIAGSVFGDLAQPLHGPARGRRARRAAWRRRRSSAPSDGFVGFNTNTATQFQNFLVLIERTDLLDDPRFAGLAGRYLHMVEWQEIIDGFMPHHPVEEIVETAAALRIPVSPVYDGETIADNEHVVARGVFVDGPDGLPAPAPSVPPRRRSAARAASRRRASASTTARSKARHRPAPTEPDADPTALPLAGLEGARRHVVVGRRRGHALPRVDGRGGDPRRVDHASRRHAPHRRRVRRDPTGGSGATCSRPRTPTSSTSPSTWEPTRAAT